MERVDRVTCTVLQPSDGPEVSSGSGLESPPGVRGWVAVTEARHLYGFQPFSRDAEGTPGREN